MEIDILVSTWGNVVLGICLVIFNGPLFLATIADGKLRRQYAVMSALLLGSFVTGVSCMGKGLNRYFVSLNAGGSGGVTDMMELSDCYKNPVILLDVLVYPLHSIQLLCTSFDRLLVVLLPIAYFIHPKRFLIIQLLLGHCLYTVIAVGTVGTAIVFQDRNVSTYCRQSEVVPGAIFTFYVSFRAVICFLNIITMAGVLLFLKRQMKMTVKIAGQGGNMKSFLRKQRSYTKAMLISCGFTCVLYIVPSLIGCYSHVDNWSSRTAVNTYMTLTGYTDSMNQAIVMLISEWEVRQKLLGIFGCSSKAKAMTVVTVLQTRNPTINTSLRQNR